MYAESESDEESDDDDAVAGSGAAGGPRSAEAARWCSAVEFAAASGAAAVAGSRGEDGGAAQGGGAGGDGLPFRVSTAELLARVEAGEVYPLSVLVEDEGTAVGDQVRRATWACVRSGRSG